jgi:predicted GH43/DUF377 family glycosyl hydrolase
MKWEKYANNPVIHGIPNSVEAWTADPTVIFDGELFHMWYTGAGQHPWRMFHASGRDGLNWTRSDKSVNDVGHRATVVLHDGRYWMFLGHGAKDPDFQLHMADRPEGPFKHAQTVMKPETEWEGDRLYCPDVIFDRDEGLWKMWYSSKTIRAGEGWPEPEAIGFATSRDGLKWTKHPGNPILGPTKEIDWMSHAVCTLMVVKHDGAYLGFSNCVGSDGHSRIALFRSPDGIRWDASQGELILDLGKEGDFDAAHLFAPAAVLGPSGWMLWYNGKCGKKGSAVESIGVALGR